MDFRYFLAGRPLVTRPEAASLGLAYAFEASVACRECMAGPGGLAGCVFGVLPAGSPAESLGFFPDRQVWTPVAELGCDGPEGLFIGHESADPPTPEELRRGQMVPGYAADLEPPAGWDGPWRWTIPRLRVYPEGTEAPSAMSFGPGGAVLRRPLERYRAACELAERLWDQARRGQGLLEEGESVEEMTAAEELQAAVDILQVNYRVGRAELGSLGTLTTGNVSLVAMLAVDMPMYVALNPACGDEAKKNASPTSGEAG